MKTIISILAMSLVCGFLQVVRIPMPLDKYADDGSVTNRTWTSLFDKRPDLRVFPTVKMRCAVTKAMVGGMKAMIDCKYKTSERVKDLVIDRDREKSRREGAKWLWGILTGNSESGGGII